MCGVVCCDVVGVAWCAVFASTCVHAQPCVHVLVVCVRSCVFVFLYRISDVGENDQ